MIRYPSIPALVALMLSSQIQAAGLNDLSDEIHWTPVAHGVWSATLGDLDDELPYTRLAAAPPRLDQLNQLSEEPFPFQARPVRYRVSPDHKLVVHIPADPDERIFGFGLQFDTTYQSRQVVDLKVDHFKRGGGATHAPVPFYISSRGYGVFFNTAKYLKVYTQVGNRKDSPRNPEPVDRNPPPDEKQPGPWSARPPADAVEASLHGSGLQVIVFRGQSLQDVVARYNLFCGGGAMPPLWGLGFWHRTPATFDADQTLAEVAQFREHDIPLDVIGLEPGWQTKSYPCTYEWQPKRFPDPRAFTAQLLEQGIRLNLWINPYVSPAARIYPAMEPLSGSHLVWLGLVPDFTLRQARQTLVNQFATDHVGIGVSGYKIDEVDGYDYWLWPDHATFPSGTSAEVMRQTYGMQVQHMLNHELYRPHGQRTYGLVRASNGAASGYPFAIYSDSYGHGEYITGLSAASLCGILWCPEIRTARNEREWINRMHTVCFSPLAMLNAWASGTKPWSYGTMTDSVRETIQLRMRLLPYLYTAFADYHQRGIPPVRSMLLEYGAVRAQTVDVRRTLDGETDPYADGQHQEIREDNSLYMFGPSILVAPFFEAHATARTIQLPPGNWYDFYSGTFAGNGDAIDRTAKQMGNRIPLFVKDGAVIPMLTAHVNNTRGAYGHPLEVRHYGKMPGRCTVYEDDGTTFAYEKGSYRQRTWTVDEGGAFHETITKDDAPALFGPVERIQTQMGL